MENKNCVLVWAFALCLSIGLSSKAMAQTSEGVRVFWDSTTHAADLGNGGLNNGVINILGDDGINTLTITAIEAGTPNGPDAVIAKSSQAGLIVQNPGGLDPWWRNGNYMDVQFSLSGGATQLFLGGGVFNWFNTFTGGNPEPGGTGESVIIKNMTLGGTTLATLDHTNITTFFPGLDGVLIDGLGLQIPLGDTIRIEALNTTGGWPENSWLTRLINFSTITTPPPLLADYDGDLDVDGADFLVLQRGFGTTYNATDLTNWTTEYGSTAPAVAGATAAVPEPTTFGLLVGGCLLIGSTYRRRRNSGLAV